MHNASEPHYWLLTGAVPSGPFTPSQIHQKIAAGEITAETPACLMGGSQWLPLTQTPGIGAASAMLPTATLLTDPPSTAGIVPPSNPPQVQEPTAVSMTPSGTASATPSPPAPKQDWLGHGIGVVVLGVIIVVVLGGLGSALYGVYEWLRPESAREVCAKLSNATTAAEAKRYVTPRMYPALEELYRTNTPDNPNDHFELTNEIDGPANSKLIGIRGSAFVQEAGQRLRLEGHLKVVKADGWKVDDLVINGIEGQTLPGPLSMVEEYEREHQTRQPKTGLLPPPSLSKTRPVTPPLPPKARPQPPIEKKFWALQESLGWGGLVALIIGIVVVLVIYGHVTDKNKK